MSRYFVKNGSYAYQELPVKEIGTGKTFTLTQPKTLFNEDYYAITRFIAVENVPVDDYPEQDFYVYRISYSEYGPVCCIKIVSEDVLLDIIDKYKLPLIRGDANECLRNYFEGK